MTRRQRNIASLSGVIPALIVGSFMPTTAKVWLGTTSHYEHVAVHMAAFAITAWLLLSLADTRYRRILAALAVCLFAWMLETGEWLIYRNAMEWLDVRDDVFGVFVALIVTWPRGSRTESANREASGK